MSQLIAPYKNSMRLGQRFNSYTHQNSLLNAITIKRTDTYTPSHSSTSHDHDEDEDEDEEIGRERPAEKEQIVSFSTRFVEKISDVAKK